MNSSCRKRGLGAERLFVRIPSKLKLPSDQRMSLNAKRRRSVRLKRLPSPLQALGHLTRSQQLSVVCKWRCWFLPCAFLFAQNSDSDSGTMIAGPRAPPPRRLRLAAAAAPHIRHKTCADEFCLLRAISGISQDSGIISSRHILSTASPTRGQAGLVLRRYIRAAAGRFSRVVVSQSVDHDI